MWLISNCGQSSKVRRTLGQPEVLIVGPRTIMPLTGESPATSSTPMLRWAPGIELQPGAILRTSAPVDGEYGLRSRNGRHSLDNRVRPLSEPMDERLQIGGGGNLLLPSFELVGAQH